MLRKSSTAVFLGLVAAPGIVQAQLNPVPIIPTTEAPRTSVNGAVRVEESAGYKGTFQNTGMNFASAMKVKDGVIIRAKRMIKPGDDTAKEIIGNIPVASTVANIFTLGLFKRAMRPTGANMRATWMAVNCSNKTFDVANDGYNWQDIYNDAYAQAEELYFLVCEPSQDPPYVQLPSADITTISKTGIKSIEVFPPSLALDIQRKQERAKEETMCDRKIRKYSCSWSTYLDANPSVKVWAELNPEMANKEKIKLNAKD